MSFKITAESDLWESRSTFTLVTLFFDESHFEATIMVSLTSMLVMYTLFRFVYHCIHCMHREAMIQCTGSFRGNPVRDHRSRR
jgi:hypothetical protein